MFLHRVDECSPEKSGTWEGCFEGSDCRPVERRLKRKEIAMTETRKQKMESDFNPGYLPESMPRFDTRLINAVVYSAYQLGQGRTSEAMIYILPIAAYPGVEPIPSRPNS